MAKYVAKRANGSGMGYVHDGGDEPRKLSPFVNWGDGLDDVEGVLTTQFEVTPEEQAAAELMSELIARYIAYLDSTIPTLLKANVTATSRSAQLFEAYSDSVGILQSVRTTMDIIAAQLSLNALIDRRMLSAMRGASIDTNYGDIDLSVTLVDGSTDHHGD